MSRGLGLGIVKREGEEMTIDKLKSLFPAKKSTITAKTVELINAASNDPEFDGATMVDSMTTFQGCMAKNSASMEEYINALKFCAYLESTNDSYVEAYKKTFGYRDFVRERLDVSTDSAEYRELTSAASRYRKTPLVVDILTQADVPLYLMFQGARYKAVNVLVHEMEHANYSKDKINAADKLLSHVKPPETMEHKMELDIGIKKDDIIDNYEMAMARMVEQQQELIKAGGDLKSIANASIKKEEIIEGEIDE